MDQQMKQDIKNLEMIDFSIHLSEKCKAHTGQSIVKQVSSLVAYAHQRDQQTGPEQQFGSLHKHTVY